ncbi:hypothetical protein TIFTF001_004430 [Ficus carica]|uniref:Uncharacterized protein n=1 Tax=Ficus carica TaxID=3494 RepID=A0AA87ZHS3_FICCA|nr:hypothetical protein TIFTF001_004430 [Ficus carica]
MVTPVGLDGRNQNYCDQTVNDRNRNFRRPRMMAGIAEKSRSIGCTAPILLSSPVTPPLLVLRCRRRSRLTIKLPPRTMAIEERNSSEVLASLLLAGDGVRTSTMGEAVVEPLLE